MTKPKKKLLYASPFPPMRSGISDYSVILTSVLAKFCDITLYVDNYDPEYNTQYANCTILKNKQHVIDFAAYDYRIYNIGNNPEFHSYIYEAALRYPGLVILHDFILYFLFCGYYIRQNCVFSKIYETYGIQALNTIKSALKKGKTDLLLRKELANLLPFNQELLLSDNLIMTHSDYAYNKVSEIVNNPKKIKKINMIPQVIPDFTPIAKKALYSAYGIPEDCLVICSFGFVAPTKLNHIVCDVVKTINAEGTHKLCYVMVGEGHYLDGCLTKTIFKTGFTELVEFNSFIAHADIVVNLRYPSMGETSAAMIRILELGKASVVSDDAWFSELPDSVALKINNDQAEEELYAHLKRLISHPEERSELGKQAQQYIRNEYNPHDIAGRIISFMDEHAE